MARVAADGEQRRGRRFRRGRRRGLAETALHLRIGTAIQGSPGVGEGVIHTVLMVQVEVLVGVPAHGRLCGVVVNRDGGLVAGGAAFDLLWAGGEDELHRGLEGEPLISPGLIQLVLGEGEPWSVDGACVELDSEHEGPVRPPATLVIAGHHDIAFKEEGWLQADAELLGTRACNVIDSRCVDKLHGLVDLEEGLEACARFKGWQHRHKHVVQEERAAVHSDGARQQTTEVADIPALGGLQLRGHLVLAELPHGKSSQCLVRPCGDLAVVHVGRDDDPELALAPLAVQYDHVLGVSTEPCLHGFADGAQPVQGGRVQLRPAEVLDLGV